MFETNLMREESFLTDFQLICEDKEFLVHKVILSAASPYFKEHFLRNSQTASLQMDFINSKTLDTVLMFIYQGRIDLRNASQPFLKDLLEASIRLQIPLMSNYCLEQFLGTQQFLSQWNKIEQLNSVLIQQIYLEYLHKTIKTLKTTESFLNLRFEQLNAVLKCPVSNPVNEEELISSILLWVKHDQSKRLNRITDLIATIDFNKLSKSFIIELIDEPLLRDNPSFEKKCAQLFYSDLKKSSNSDVSRGDETKSLKTQTKRNSSMGKKTFKRKESDLHKTNIHQRNHKQITEKVEDSIPSISNDDNSLTPKRILAYDSDKWNNLMEYKTDINKWIQVTDETLLNSFSKVKYSTVCSFENYIYFLGGAVVKYTQVIDRCYKLDVLKNKFFKINPMIKGRSGAAAVKLDHFIYVIGGHFDYNTHLNAPGINTPAIEYSPKYTNLCEKYNLITGFWESMPAIPFEYHTNPGSVVAFDGRLCLIGKTNLIWFNPQNEEWSEGEDLPENCKNKYSPFVTVGNGKIFVVFKYLRDIFYFDPMNKSWETYQNTNDVVSNMKGILSLPNTKEFLIFCDNRTFIFSPPNKWIFISTVPFDSPSVILIEEGRNGRC